MSLADAIEQSDHALTVSELAEFLRVHKITVYRLARAGRIPAFRIGSAVRFDPGAVASWLRKQGGAL